jgi:hypothetical protein
MNAFAPLFSQNKNKLIVTTNCGPDNDMYPKQARWSAALGKLLVADYTNERSLIRNSDLTFYSKYYISNGEVNGINSDASNIYVSAPGFGKLYKRGLDFSPVLDLSLNSIRFVDSSGDPDYVYVTSNNAVDHHGFRQVKKSTMAVTASALADGAGDGQFDDPLGIFYYNSEVFVADYDNSRISVWTKSGETLTYARKYDLGFKPMDLAFDGTNWYVQSATNTYKYDNVFTDATKTSAACVGYSLTIIPDQSDGNGATLAISNNSGNCLYRRKCSDLSLIATVGSAGDGSASLCDLSITGAAGNYQTNEGEIIAAASGSTPTKNGFTGLFFRGTGGNRVTFRPTAGKSLKDITAIDFNDDQISGEIKNLYKCSNLTSCKLQTNPALVLDLGRLSAKMQTLWAYACGAGIFGSIRHITALTALNIRENGATQTQVDGWIDDLWQNRDVMGTPQINLNGTNISPSGIYQDATPPTTGKEKVFDLVENYGWSVATS